MNREDILCSLQQMPDIEIAEVNDDSCIIYDDITGKVTQYNFAMSKRLLTSKIHISDAVTRHVPMAKEKLAAYLLANVDEHAFLTLEKIYFVYDKSDYEKIAKQYRDLSPMDFWKTKEQGVMWFDHNICIIGVKNIIEKEKCTSYNRDFEIKRRIIWVTIHELRHVMMDTTIILDQNVYPPNLGEEISVDEYACEVTDNTVSEWMEVFR